MELNKMNILSLFDGISCARVSLERAGIKVDNYYASEIDKYAIQIAQKNYPDTIQLGDIREVDHGMIARLQNKMIAEIDLMILGSPCQDLSIAKKNRQGLKGERSGLFYEAIRIHKQVMPKWFIYENVNSMAQDQKDLMLKAVKEIDQNAYMIMINAALVSAQNRKRIFITNIPNIQQPEDRGILLKDILENGDVALKNYGGEKIKSNTVRTSGRGSGIDDKHNWDTICIKGITMSGTFGKRRIAESDKAYCLAANPSSDQQPKVSIRIGQIGKGGQGDRIYSPEGKSVNLSANGGGRGAKTGLYAIPVALRNCGEGKKPEYNGTEKANAMTTVQSDSMVLENSIIRKLTPIECERLQSLPDNYTEGVSNSQRYKMLGNGMNCEVIRHILTFLT